MQFSHDEALVVGYQRFKVENRVGGSTCGILWLLVGKLVKQRAYVGCRIYMEGYRRIFSWVESIVYREHVLSMEHSGSVLGLARLQSPPM